MLANSERYYVQKQGVSEIRLQQADEVCKCLKSLAALTKETYMKCKHLSYQPVYNYNNKKRHRRVKRHVTSGFSSEPPTSPPGHQHTREK